MLRFNFERRHWLMLVTANKELIEEYDEAMVDDKGPRGAYDDIMEALKEAAELLQEDFLNVATCFKARALLERWGFD